MEYPELAARTRRFSAGSPRAIGVADDGSRVVFLRSGGPEDLADRLHVLDLSTGAERLIADPVTLLADAGDLPPEERALRERRRLSAGGIGSYAIDRAGAVAAFTLAGRLFRADLDAGTVAEVPTAGPVVDPRPDPTGTRIAYVTAGTLRVTGPDMLIAGEEGITWGLAEFIAAEEFDRYRGYWWAPDGRSLLATRVDETRVPAELADPRWVSPVPGTPAYLGDGRVLVGGELAHDGFDARCLFADGSLLTPPSLYVHRVCGQLRDGSLLVEASDGEPSEQHLYRIGTRAGAPVVDAGRITSSAGMHYGAGGGDTIVVGAVSLDHAGVRWSVYRSGEKVGEIGR